MQQGGWRAEILLAVALWAIAAAAVAGAYVNHDAAWYLYMADRWLSGATLYLDVFDTNPPLILAVSAPPVLIGRLSGAAVPALFKGYVLVLAAGSLAASGYVLRKVSPEQHAPLLTAAAFALLPFVQADFGQREHFAVLLTVPYVLAAGGARGLSRRWRILAGVAGGIGFAVKPYFLVAWILVEAAAAAFKGTSRLRSPLALAAAGVFVLYGAAIAALVPQYFDAAAKVRRIYGGFNADRESLLGSYDVCWWVGAALAAALLRRRLDRRALVLFAAGAGFLVAALLQLKGWSYQFYPARVYLILFAAAAASAVTRSGSGQTTLRAGRWLTAAAGMACLTLAVRYSYQARHPRTPDMVGPLIAAIRETAPQGPVVVLSTRTFLYPAFPAVNYTGARWAMRQNSLLLLEAFYAEGDRFGRESEPSHTLETMPPLERALFDDVVQDLCTTEPQLVLIDAPGAARRDVRAYLHQSAQLAPWLDGLRPRGTIGFLTVATPTRGCN